MVARGEVSSRGGGVGLGDDESAHRTAEFMGLVPSEQSSDLAGGAEGHALYRHRLRYFFEESRLSPPARVAADPIYLMGTHRFSPYYAFFRRIRLMGVF